MRREERSIPQDGTEAEVMLTPSATTLRTAVLRCKIKARTCFM